MPKTSEWRRVYQMREVRERVLFAWWPRHETFTDPDTGESFQRRHWLCWVRVRDYMACGPGGNRGWYTKSVERVAHPKGGQR